MAEGLVASAALDGDTIYVTPRVFADLQAAAARPADDDGAWWRAAMTVLRAAGLTEHEVESLAWRGAAVVVRSGGE